MMNETRNALEEVIRLHLKGIKEIGPTADKATTLVDNTAKLYRLAQKDDETEMRHDEERERLACDNGRADLELRAKEHQIATDSEKLELDRARLDFEREKFQCELAIKAESNQIEKAKLKQGNFGIMVKAGLATIDVLFNARLSKLAMAFEKDGVVGSFFGKKVLGSMLGKQKIE